MQKPITTTKDKNRIYVDPVCGMKVSAVKMNFISTYGNNNYLFCAECCLKAFEANPEKYLKPKKKGFWGRYLERLNKATEGKPMKCH